MHQTSSQLAHAIPYMGGYPAAARLFEQEGGRSGIEWPLPCNWGLLEGVKGACGVIREFDGQQVATYRGMRKTSFGALAS